MRFPYHTQPANNATIAATGVIGAAFLNLSKAQKPVVNIYLRIANAPGGTSPSLTVKLQGSPDGSNWADIPSGAFTAQTAATAANTVLRLTLTDIIDPNLQVYATVSGTTPSFSGVTIDVFISTEE